MVGDQKAGLCTLLSRWIVKFSYKCFASFVSCQLLGIFWRHSFYFETGWVYIWNWVCVCMCVHMCAHQIFPNFIDFFQINRFDLPTLSSREKETTLFSPSQPREKWIKKKTSVKLKNVAANHRANDVVIKEGAPQILAARFMYGPLDMITLAGNVRL